ncbi:MAG: DUF4118 domain-containing protein [Candidatus Methanoperedens sp.]|nr:DUF4118 domain-containing protein [Candidatus Methanoperedens sp.]MCE8425111.1 DUF4118 domain-containing protein [Candidatus Methanoperedens sp.]
MSSFIFIPPYFTFAVSDVIYFLSYILFIAFAFLISNLASNLQYKVKQLTQSESRNTTLYDIQGKSSHTIWLFFYLKMDRFRSVLLPTDSR